MSGKSTLKNFTAMLAEAKLPERTVELCLRGDLVADHEAAERELEQAQKTTGDSLAGSGVGEIVERIQALEAQMSENSAAVRMRALNRPTWYALISAHPPRRDDDNGIVEADVVGLNTETFYPELIRCSIVDPDLSAEDFDRLLEVLTSRQYDELADAAWGLNRREVDVPFSLAASRAKRASDGE